MNYYYVYNAVACFTCHNGDVTANVVQHGPQNRLEDVGIESHQFVVVQVDDLKVVACRPNIIKLT